MKNENFNSLLLTLGWPLRYVNTLEIVPVGNKLTIQLFDWWKLALGELPVNGCYLQIYRFQTVGRHALGCLNGTV